MVFLKAAAVGLITAILVGTVAVVTSLRSISRTVRDLGLSPEMEKQGYFAVEPALFALVAVAFLVGFGLALWWLISVGRGLAER
jgi:hypothetical protein